MNSVAEDKERVQAMLGEAYAGRINNLKRSVELAEEALTISRNIDDKSLTAKSLAQLSLYSMILGDYKKTIAFSEEAIRYFDELGDEHGAADARYNIAGIYYKTDNYHLGLVHMMDCLAVYKKYNDYYNQSRVEKSLGTIYEYFGDQNSAIKSYENAIEAAKMAGDQNLESNAYNNLSGVLLKQDKIEQAAEMIARSMEIKQQTGDIRGYAFAIYGRGKVHAKKHLFFEAEADYKEALRIHLEMGEKLGLGMTYHKLGLLYFEMGNFDLAKKTLNKALEFSNAYNIVIIKFKCSYLLYRIARLENDPARSLEYLERYLKEKEGVINTQTLKVIENYELISQVKGMEKEAQMQKEKAEIMEKKNRAEEAVRVRQEFLSTMSHEIRTPLNAVITITSLLKEKSDPEDKQLLDSLKFASNNLMRIINDILDLSKLDAGKAHLETRQAGLKPLLENIWRTYEPMAREKGLKLSLKTDVSLADAYELDETKISQILGNLINNAIKFTEKGSVIIEVEKMPGSDAASDHLNFKITDTGEGIAPEFLNEIFESFSQIKPITTRRHGGTGLGLAIVKKLVELHEGSIHVSSEVGKGSTFHFDLKLKKAQIPEKPEIEPSNQLEGKNALLAEDNEINAFVARKLLSKWGVVTEHAVNGIEAIEKSKERTFDFILMDIHMPEMNGFDATEQIRKNENPNQNTPIFALTADITATQQEQYKPYFTGFLWKPLQIDKLREALINA